MGHRRNHVFLPRLGFSLPVLAEAPGWLCPFLNFPPHRSQRRRSSQALSATLSASLGALRRALYSSSLLASIHRCERRSGPLRTGARIPCSQARLNASTTASICCILVACRKLWVHELGRGALHACRHEFARHRGANPCRL